jgi:ABC-type glycerol-3-phosphate transport system permease component
MATFTRLLLRALYILAVTVLAAALLLRAVEQLPIDYDEDDYLRAAFQAVPRELEESAFLDGASDWTTFLRVSLPLALPSILLAALIAFLVGYSEFALGWLFVDKGSNVTLAMAVSGRFIGFFVSGNSASLSNLAALAFLMSLPVVVIFLILQRSLLSGWLIGLPEE